MSIPDLRRRIPLVIVLALTVKLFLDLVLTPSDLASLAPAKGGGH